MQLSTKYGVIPTGANTAMTQQIENSKLDDILTKTRTHRAPVGFTASVLAKASQTPQFTVSNARKRAWIWGLSSATALLMLASALLFTEFSSAPSTLAQINDDDIVEAASSSLGGDEELQAAIYTLASYDQNEEAPFGEQAILDTIL